MSSARRSSAGFVALLLFARVAAAEAGDPQATSTPVVAGVAGPTLPKAPQVPQVGAPGTGEADKIATPFGVVSASGGGANGVSQPVVAGSAPKARAPSPHKDEPRRDDAKAEPRRDDAKASDARPASAPAAASAAPAPVAEPPAVIAAPAPPVAPAPVATGDAHRTWLRDTPKPPEAPAAKPETAVSPWRALAALLVVAALGGGAFVLRHRRRKTGPLPPGASRIVVLSSAKVGPRANAVVAEVAGRVFLLGVTDSSVSKLAVLDGGAPRPARARAASREARGELDDDAKRALLESRRAPVETAEADDEALADRPLSSKFSEMLDRALGAKAAPAGVPDFRGNPAVAALLAGDVEDTFTRGEPAPRKRPEAAPAARSVGARASRTINAEIVEEQAAGLSRKRRRA